MKTAEDFIDEILYKSNTLEEYELIKQELEVWFQTAPKEERDKFVFSGAGETLTMICS
jgi:hypothetical protein